MLVTSDMVFLYEKKITINLLRINYFFIGNRSSRILMGCKWWEETVEKDWETGDVAGKEGMHRREHWTNRRNDS